MTVREKILQRIEEAYSKSSSDVIDMIVSEMKKSKFHKSSDKNLVAKTSVDGDSADTSIIAWGYDGSKFSSDAKKFLEDLIKKVTKSEKFFKISWEEGEPNKVWIYVKKMQGS